jgi:hypothetical protein
MSWKAEWNKKNEGYILCVKVEDLKKLIKDNDFKRVNGGETYYDNDEKVTRCFLIDRYRYRKHFDVYTWDGRGWIDD